VLTTIAGVNLVYAYFDGSEHEIALQTQGIIDAVAFPGLSIAGFSAATNEGIIFFGLAPFEKRTSPEFSKFAILGKVNGAIQQIQGARDPTRAPALRRRRGRLPDRPRRRAPVAPGARCAGAGAGRPGDRSGQHLPRARRWLERFRGARRGGQLRTTSSAGARAARQRS